MDINTFYSDSENLGMPYSIEAEQAVLGCILIEPSCMTQVQLIIRPDYFYLPQHRAVFYKMVEIDSTGGIIDALIILDALKKEKIYDDASGKNYLYQLTQTVPSTANVESYARIVREKHYIRTLINASKEIIESAAAQEESADVLIDYAEQKIYNIRQGKAGNEPSKVSDIIMNKVIDRLNKLNSPEKDQFKGFSTGFSDLDDVINGLNRSDLILLGARPAMGKTSFALNIARNVADKGRHKVVFFSLEMTKEQLAQRVLSTEAMVLGNKFRDGSLGENDWKSIIEAVGLLQDCELYFDDSTDITTQEMKAKIRRMRKVDCVFIDYLGLVRSGAHYDNRVQEVTEITRSLKLMAKDLNIPVFCCAQLSRNTEGRGKSHRPQLSDLRESGSIEQDADIVMMLYRKDYYKGEDSDNEDGDEETHADEMEVIVAKNRHGPTKTVKLIWNSEYTKFTGISPENIDV